MDMIIINEYNIYSDKEHMQISKKIIIWLKYFEYFIFQILFYHDYSIQLIDAKYILLFDNDKIKMARKPGKKQKEIQLAAPGRIKDEKEI